MRPTLASLLIVFVLLVSATSASAQRVRFIDTANSWRTSGSTGAGCEWDRTIRLGADTVISSRTYKKINFSAITYKTYTVGCTATTGKGIYVREDTIDHLVFYRQPSVDQYEHVLYNYNMVVGDTIQYPYSIYPGGPVTDSVVNVDSILIGGVYHKVFDFQNVAGKGDRAYTVIEGVGCINSPVYPAFMGACADYSEKLRCFSQASLVQDFAMRLNSCNLLGNNFYINCDYIPTPTGITANATAMVTVYPNPAGSDIQVSIPAQNAGNCSVAVYDMLGRNVHQAQPGSMSQSTTINTLSWNNGSYLVVVRDGDKTVQKEMVVINH